MANIDKLLRFVADYHKFEFGQAKSVQEDVDSDDELFEEELDFIAAAGTTLLDKNCDAHNT